MNTQTLRAGKGTLIVALCGACLLLWGYVVYRIVFGLQSAPGPRPMPTVQTPAAIDPVPAIPPSPDARAAYTPDLRDPFRIPDGVLTPPRVANRGSVPPPPAPPPLTLGGIVGRTVLLQGDDGAAYVARAGEAAGPARILRVQATHAVVRYEGHTFTLPLHPDDPH